MLNIYCKLFVSVKKKLFPQNMYLILKTKRWQSCSHPLPRPSHILISNIIPILQLKKLPATFESSLSVTDGGHNRIVLLNYIL